MTQLIRKYEGFRATAYKCPAGVWTIGYGTTVYPSGKPVKQGDKCTEAEARSMLNDYLKQNVRPKIADLKLKPHQQEAIESLCYNIGVNAFLRSKCYKALKEKDWATFIKEYDWFKAGGKVLNGLVKRRVEELALFFSDL